MNGRKGPEFFYRDRVTLEKIPGVTKPSYDPLDLYSKNAYLYAYRDTEARKEYYLYSYLHNPLRRNSLAEGLAVATPQFHPRRERQGIGGIRADWYLMDRTEKDNSGLNYEWVRQMHRQLFDPDWTIWNAYGRIPFLNALDSLKESELMSIFGREVNRLVDKPHMTENPAEYLFSSKSRVMWFWEEMRYGSPSYDYYNPKKPIHEWLSKREVPLTPQDLFSKIKKRPSGKQLLAEMPEELIGSLLNRFVHEKGYIPVDTNKEPGTVYERNVSRGQDMKFRYLGDRKISIDLNGGWGLAEFSEDGKIQVTATDWSGYKYKEAALTPHIVIEHDMETGEFNYLYDNVPSAVSCGKNANAEARLGLMMAAYLSEEQRDAKKRRVTVEYQGKKYKQTISEPQTLLIL